MTRTEILDQIKQIELPENFKVFIVIEEDKGETTDITISGELSNIGITTILNAVCERDPISKQEIRATVLEGFIKETKQQYEPVVNMLVSAFSSAFEKPEVEQKEETPVNQMSLFDAVPNM